MSVKTVQLKYLAKVTLGKMLQPAESIQIGQEIKPYLKASSITTSGLDLGNLQEMPFSAKEQSHLDLRKNDVVVVEGGSIGRSAYIKEDLPGIHFQNSVNRVRPLPGNDGRYINYALMFLEQSGYFESITNQATIRHLTAEKLERVPIPVRSYEEQKRIADELDRELAEIEKFIADQLRLKGLLKEQLEAQKEKIILEAGGQKVRLSRVLKGIKDGTHGTHPRVDSGGEVLLSAKNISSGELVISEDESRISLEEAAQITASGFPRKGDVMMILVGATYGRTALYNLEQTLPFQRSVGFFRPNEELITSDYLKLVMSSSGFQEQLSLGIKTSAQPGIYLGDVSFCRITLPSINNQKKFIELHGKHKFNHKELIKLINQSIRILNEKNIHQSETI